MQKMESNNKHKNEVRKFIPNLIRNQAVILIIFGMIFFFAGMFQYYILKDIKLGNENIMVGLVISSVSYICALIQEGIK